MLLVAAFSGFYAKQLAEVPGGDCEHHEEDCRGGRACLGGCEGACVKPLTSEPSHCYLSTLFQNSSMLAASRGGCGAVQFSALADSSSLHPGFPDPQRCFGLCSGIFFHLSAHRLRSPLALLSGPTELACRDAKRSAEGSAVLAPAPFRCNAQEQKVSSLAWIACAATTVMLPRMFYPLPFFRPSSALAGSVCCYKPLIPT